MRVTNQMVTSSSLRNMQKSMQRVSKLNQQVTTHKKISAPSEDPVIAIRALKLRTTVDQLDQYKSKNIKDALSWLGTTQDSIENVYQRLQDVYYYCEQGATDTFQTKDRNTIINELYALKDAIYREGGSTYAGRYLFSGYKTETNLLFQDTAAKEGLSYNITEDISPNKIIPKSVVLNGTDPSQLDDILDPASGTQYQQPVSESVYQLRLAYSNLDHAVDNTDPANPVLPITIEVTMADGTVQQITPNIKQMADSATYYDVADGEVNFIPETGELIFGDDIYNTIKTASNISVNYDKSEFEVGDLRPEMYFNCTRHKTMPDGTIQDTDFTVDKAGQPIQYEVNFNQYITVNAEGKDFIYHDMGNKIEDLANAVQDVLDIENTIAKLKGLLEDPQYKDDENAVAQINRMLEGADVELALKREKMQKLFGNNMTNFQNFMEDVSAVQAKVGTTYSKLELIEVRVTEQLANFKELKSSNEDVDTEEAAIEMYQAELVYEASLASTASVVKKTLLDYL
ncbi:MAG: flagellar hook-associated protein FlgL [Lachnospiraceae bacterium]|nr:flagellar hook-associated protein FlgL [Lachnospiraceae bacterium]